MRKFRRREACDLRHGDGPKFAHLAFLFTVLVSVIFAVTMFIVTGGMLLLNGFNVITLPAAGSWTLPAVLWFFSSLFVGMITAALVSHIPIRPFRALVDGMCRLARGEYSVRLKGGHLTVVRKLTDSFNALAAELENTEMLRMDFVNNFSHEFKTPIVSIRGFAKLLKRADIPAAKRDEYLEIIVDEATRLTDLADNVLSLAKIEKQSILTDVAPFNLSEQIRTSVLLLQKKWEYKNLEIEFDEYEHTCTGSEELLKQVWINLLDNAVKFAPAGSRVTVHIERQPESVCVSIANQGVEIEGPARRRMFEKFYQGDSSHATEGTGLGLAIVRRIVELHKGTVEYTYRVGRNLFSVTLPQPPEKSLESH